jgi:two-component system OmpR family sensor kinase
MTTWPARLPIRARITAAFAAVSALLLVGIGVLAYESMGAALLDEIDAGLRFRAEATVSSAQAGTVDTPNPQLQEPGEAFAQLSNRRGRVLRASAGFSAPLLRPAELGAVRRPTFFQRRVPNVVGPARLLAISYGPAADSAVLVVGTSMADRTDALRRLTEVFVIGAPVAIALACLAGWVVAGLALQPMERMRQQASAITASGLDRRLSIPAARDQLRRLAETLNDMLGRLDRSLARERAFLERAGHELRTPLAALRAEVDLALRRPRAAAELSVALQSVSQETDRLTRLAEDLLVLARADDGRLPLHREDIPLAAALESAAALFGARALELGITLTVTAAPGTVYADPMRLRQALVNLLDNALRHTPRGGTVSLDATADESSARIVISDTGAGFDHGGPAFDGADDLSQGEHGTSGLGLRIVHAIVRSHRGMVRVDGNRAGGAAVELTLPGRDSPPAGAPAPSG